ncbi:MAG: ABC transporter permease, partial [Deltaproteobacteria bacterium]|nr:ABC transporter permease [Deltaproteobacteria bacterium]
MERRRTWASFGLASAAGILASVGLMLAAEQLIAIFFPALDPTGPAAYICIGLQGIGIGILLGSLVDYYPSIEGWLASSCVLARLLVRDDFQVGMGNAIELGLKFEVHFASVFAAAFAVFLIRGGGLYYPFFVGMRYLRFKMITAISVVGVALGVAALMVVLAVVSGFESDLKEKVVGTNAHAILQKRGIDFGEHELVMEKLGRVEGVAAATPFTYNEVMVTSRKNLAGVFIRGVDPKTVEGVTPLELDAGRLEWLEHPERIPIADGPRPARPAEAGEGSDFVADPDAGEVPMPGALKAGRARARYTPGILLGRELAENLGARPGDPVKVISPLSEDLGPSGPVPRSRAFRVAGIFHTGMYEYDAKSVVVSLRASQDFFGMGETITGIALRFHDVDQAAERCRDILAVLDGYPYFTRTWYQMNKNLFSALKLQKVGMFIILVVVILVSAFGIISTLIMLVWEKIKEIA